jgi:hypothetical protein
MRKLIAPILLALALTGCAGKSAVVSPAVDALALRLAAGAALDANPQYVVPVYAATSAALAVLESGKPVALDQIEARVAAQLDLEARPPEERGALLAVIITVKAELTARLTDRGLAPEDARLYVTELIRILNETAAARLAAAGVQRRDNLCGGWSDFAALRTRLQSRARANRADFEARYGICLDAIVDQAAVAADTALGL